MSAPSDTTANYVALMRERGWNWGDLADEFDRQAQSPALDGGAAARSMARWARSEDEAARQRRESAAPEREPQDPRPEPPKRTAVPPRPNRRG
jgi:hypothetical protein